MRTSRVFALVAVAASLAAVLGAVRVAVGPRAAAVAPEAPLAEGSPSLEALVDRFLGALSAGDREALSAMRVSEAEYREVIVPGSVAPGESPQRLDEAASRYWWQDLDARSTYSSNDLLRRYAGRPLRRVDFRFDKGTRRFANHVAHRRLVVVARDDRGEEFEIRTGSIVDVEGRFKFVSFVRG